jgi:hypothetical protein
VTATNGGGAVVGATILSGTTTTTTSGSGGYSLALTSNLGTVPLTIQGPGLLTRGMFASPSTHALNADVIQLAGFDATLYRELVRDAFEAPTNLQALRRWTKNLNIFLQSNGTDAATVTMVEAVIRDSVPKWTNGTLTVGTFEKGTLSPHLGQLGWLTVQFEPNDPGRPACGQSHIALEGGIVALWTTPQCACSGLSVAQTTVRHELGHALGFFHTDQPSDVMFPFLGQCDLPISSRELAAAAVAYRRPVGNTEPDNDPLGAVNLLPILVR